MSNEVKEMTPAQAWELFDLFVKNNYQPVEGLKEITLEFSKLLAQAPRVEVSEVNNQGYTIEYSDCFHLLLVRIPEISNNWETQAVINTWDSSNSYEPEIIYFNNGEYLLDLGSNQIYKKLEEKDKL